MRQWIDSGMARALVAWCGGATMAACGGLAGEADNEDAHAASSGPSAPTSPEEFRNQLNRIYCDWLVPCCTELETPITTDECTSCTAQVGNPEYADPDNYSFYPSVAADCLAAARQFHTALTCDLSGLPGDYKAELYALCDSAFAGKLEPGAPCSAHIECAMEPGDEVECTSWLGEFDEPVCVVRRDAAEGEPCTWTCTGSHCWGSELFPGLQGECHTEDQLYCESGVCARQPALGEGCTGDAICADGVCEADVCTAADRVPCEEADARCGVGHYCESTRCAPLQPSGSPCESGLQCQSGICSDERLCVDRVPPSVTSTCSNIAVWN